jgi:fatty-acid desaturase
VLTRAATDPIAALRPSAAHTWWIDWTNLFAVISNHALAVLAFTPWFFSWWGVGAAVVGHYTIGVLGIGLCYHRLLTHRAFSCPKWLEYSLALLGVFSSQDSPAWWVAVHRQHHQYADEGRDPHTPLVGFFWAHIGWLVLKNEMLEREVITGRHAKDLMRQPFYAWLERFWLALVLAEGIVIFAAGCAVGMLSGATASDAILLGITANLWGTVVRRVLTWHATFAVNSLSHRFGYRNYDTGESSRNNVLVTVLMPGEGWHNNHHAAPRSAMHGHRRWELDPVFMVIRLLAALGLAWDIVTPAAYRRLESRGGI